jgi:hypothetical protein
VSVVEGSPVGWGVVAGWLNTPAKGGDGSALCPSLEAVAEASELVQQAWERMQR